MKVALGTLKDKGDELATFLEPRVGAKPSLAGDSMEIEDESVREGVKPRHVKTYIKRFLYMKGVREKYRVFVAGKELTIQEIEVGEEKEEEKKKGPEKKVEEVKAEPESPEAVAPAPTKEEPTEEPKAAKPKKAAPKKPRAKKKKAGEED
ncbi:MAG TPA: hypothetical protein VEB87_00260 [Nitrososphaerales archaeon]|nr:hypothetical protein [Nitrososphaerales archaeon]